MPPIRANLHGAADAPLRKSTELTNTVAQSARGISENRRSRTDAAASFEMASAVKDWMIGAAADGPTLALIDALA
jgi:hypothetical protein